MKKLIVNYVELPKKIKKPLWRLWHNMIIKFDRKNTDNPEIFLNYGYSNEGEFDYFQLKEEDKADKYSIQLYAHASRHHKFEGTDVLEVGSGRGGGAYFLSRYFKPKSYVALDINQKTVDFCNKTLKADGLSFVQGEAEKLPFEDESFDAVVNVESARCYGDIPKFFSEVKRVLKPGGKFCFIDMIKPEDYDQLVEDLKATGMKIIETKNVLPNVVEALKKDTAQRKRKINSSVPKPLQTSFHEFAGKIIEEYSSPKAMWELMFLGKLFD